MEKENERERVHKLLAKGNFVKSNGKILRMLNVVDENECTLQNVRMVMQDILASDFQKSLLYLEKSGYIQINYPDGSARAENDFLGTPASIELTSEGIELLMGITNNPAVEV